MPIWKRNLIVCWLGAFTTSCGICIVVPFMPLYIEQLGVSNVKMVSQLSGAAFSITFLAAAVMSPVWGKLADAHGRKTVMMCTSLGLAISNFFYPFVHQVSILIVVRLLQGVVSGYNPSANALIARMTPDNKAGWALATLSTGSMAGSLLGPIIGGWLDTMMSMRNTFFVTTVSLFFSFLIAAVFVREDTETEPSRRVVTHPRPGSVFSQIEGHFFFIAIMVSICVINAANQSIEPIVSLFIRQLLVASHTPSTYLSLLSGIVISATGFGILLTASRIGGLADRRGYMPVLLVSLACSSALFVPMAFVTNAWQLTVLRFVFGISQAGIGPIISTLLKKMAPPDIFGRVFGVYQGMTYLGLVFGPMLGSTISSTLGFTHIFFVTSAMLAGNLVLVALAAKRLPQNLRGAAPAERA